MQGILLTVTALLALLLSFYASLRDPVIQTFAARLLATYLSSEMDTKITLNGFYLHTDLSINLIDLTIYDRHEKLMLHTDKVNVQPLNYDFGKGLSLKSINLENLDVRLIRYDGEDDFNYEFIADYFASDSEELPSESKSYPIHISKLILKNANFAYIDEPYAGGYEEGMDYSAIEVSDINLEASDLNINEEGIFAAVRHLSAKEKSGFELKRVKAEMQLLADGLHTQNLLIETANSYLHLDLDMLFEGSKSFNNFIDEVRLKAEFGPSSLQLADIAPFAGVMNEMPNLINFSGDFDGVVSNFSLHNFSFSYGDDTKFLGNLSMNGLPEFYTTDIYLGVNRMRTTLADLRQFRIPIEEQNIPLPEEIADPGIIELNGLFRGTYNDFLARANIHTDLGDLNTDLIVRTHPISRKVIYKGGFETKQLQLGKLIHEEKIIGNLSLALQVDGSGYNFETAQADVKGNVFSIGLFDNVFHDIHINGNLSSQQFNGAFAVDDEKLKLDFEGLADFRENRSDFDFICDIHHLDLFELGLMDEDTLMQLQTKFTAQFTGFDLDSFLGKVELKNTTYTDSRDAYNIDKLSLQIIEDPILRRKLFLNSDFFDFELAGMYDLENMLPDLKLYLQHYISTDAVSENELVNFGNQDFYFNLTLKDTEPLSRLLNLGLTIAEGTYFSGAFTARHQQLQATFYADWLDYSGVKFLKPYLVAKSDFDLASLKLEMQRIHFFEGTEDDTTSFGMDDPILMVQMHSDSVLFGLNWNNHKAKPRNKGLINGFYHYAAEDLAVLRIKKADVIINDSVLELQKDNRIYFTKEYTKLENFNFKFGGGNLNMEGNIPIYEKDSLQMVFNNWDLSAFDVITRPQGIDLDGIINGELVLANLSESPDFASNLHISDFFFNKEKLGEARLISSSNQNDGSIYLNAQIINEGNVALSKMLHLRGFYYPDKQDDQLDLTLSLDNFKLRILNQFLEDILSKIEGVASGEFKIAGNFLKPEIVGELSLYRTSFRIDYLNTTYSTQHTFRIEPKKIFVDNLILYDSLGNAGIVDGMINSNYLRDFVFDIRIKPNNLIALNTGLQHNDMFYGTAVISGNIVIQGPLDNINMNINAVSRRGTNIVIPLNTIGTIGTNDYIHFVERFNMGYDSEEYVPHGRAAKEGFMINLETEVTPDASLQIYLPYDMGTLEARGNGDISMTVDESGDFALKGDYVVENGQFNFSFENLIKKKFELVQGGTISWAGDPYDAEIDVTGVYKVKASVSGLGIDSTSSLRNRINVDCIIHLTNQLFNPDIRFSFHLPGADSQLEQLLFSVIDTTNDAMMTQQMISLLMLGSFSASAIDNISIGSTSLDMLSGQLSNWLSQISKDFDIGLHYRPGDQLTSEELEVALSTQLFNDRVTIDGNFGVINNRNATQNASNIVGDFDVSVRLTQDGRLQLKAFNHSNASNLMLSSAFDRYAPYTQGIGFSFRQEFNKFAEIFRRRKQQIH